MRSLGFPWIPCGGSSVSGSMEWIRVNEASAEGSGYLLTTTVRWNVPGNCRKGWKRAGEVERVLGLLRKLEKLETGECLLTDKNGGLYSKPCVLIGTDQC